MTSDAGTTEQAESPTEQAYIQVRAALDEANALVLAGILALRPLVGDDDTFKLSDVLEDVRHDLTAARRKAERVLRDHDRRTTR